MLLSQSGEQSNDETPIDLSIIQEGLNRYEMIKNLESQLLRANEERDRAVAVLIHVIGTEKINKLLKRHQNSTNIFDAIQSEFSKSEQLDSQRVSAATREVKSSSSKYSAPMRSRMDEYFKSTIVRNDL